MTQQLPHSDQLDIAALSRLFRNKATSYKYLFFLSLLTLLKDRDFEIDDGISLRDIEIEMLVTAWYPNVFSKLSFGIQDKIASVWERIPNFDHDKNFLSKTGLKKLRKHVDVSREKSDYGLMRYVSKRILRPFFDAETSGSEQGVDQKIVELAAKHFRKRRPLYRFDDARKCIFLHPDWIAYLQQHQTIIEGWALWHWADYMQRRNPSIPAVTQKLFPPDPQRGNPDVQRKFWKQVISKKNIQCIYTGKDLNSDYALDHFLPWKFVAHNQLWNLIPVDPQANSSKRDWLPSEKYIDCLAKTQCNALSIARDIFSNNEWKKKVEPYITDLHIEKPEHTLDFEILRFAYRRTLEPLMSIAEQQGFHCGWTYG